MPRTRVGKKTIKLPYGRKGGRKGGRAGGFVPKGGKMRRRR